MSSHRTAPRSNSVASALALVLITALGCGGARPSSPDEDPAVDPESAPSFLAVRGPETSAAEAARMRKKMAPAPAALVSPESGFYLAIHRRELGRRWFVSAYLKQFSPDAVQGGAASSLGMRVVSFRIQNGKLFMFDADDRHRTSDTFSDEQIVDAYPLVDPAQLTGVDTRKLDDYVVVDPAAGLNRYGVVGDAYGAGYLGFDSFKVELAFSQNFRALPDGATFEQAFTGYTGQPHPNLDQVDPNFFRASGVLGLALRRYQEGEGFVPLAQPPGPRYFVSEPRRIPNTGETERFALKWNIHPGMAPIEWLISPLVLKAQERPELVALGVDLVAAVKAGIESWNAAFGFPALSARLASENDSFADDDKNYLIWDVNPTIGFAFADFRPNPNTGQIRGASVYFNDGFVDEALYVFGPPPPAGAEVAASSPTGTLKQRRLAWQPMRAQPLCDLHPEPLARLNKKVGFPAEIPADPKAQIEKGIAYIVAHEIGHTLGLRHNFKGSLLPPSSSVMDYISMDLGVAGAIPAAYDVDAIRYLYGLARALPAQPFCTDDHVGTDPTCARFDRGADPLREYWARLYQLYARYYLSTGNALVGRATRETLLPELVHFIQSARTAADREAAWNFTVADIGVPADPAAVEALGASYTEGANALLSSLFGKLVPDPASLKPLYPGGPLPTVPPIDPATTNRLLGQLGGVLLDSDGIRSFPARRLSVDTLHWMQSLPAYGVLRDARVALSSPPAPTGAVAPDRQALLEDLLARLQRAVTPYFDK